MVERISQKSFNIRYWLILGPCRVILFLIAYFLLDSTITILIPFIINFLIEAYAIIMIVQRLHDASKTGIWVLLILIPLISFFLILWCSFAEGEEGENKYGPDPRDKKTMSKGEINATT